MSSSSSYPAASYQNVLPREAVEAVRPGVQAPIVPPGQQWAAVSFVGNHAQKQYAMSILGVFETKQETQRWVEKLRRSGFVQFDVWPLPLNEFICVSPPPDPAQATDVYYADPVLEKIMRGHQDELMTADKRVAERVKMLKDKEKPRAVEEAGDVQAAACEEEEKKTA